MAKIEDSKLVEIAQIYNNQGRKAAYHLMESVYGIKHPYAVLKRIKKHAKFTYDNVNDCYQFQENSNTEEIFMSVDELCSPVQMHHQQTQQNDVFSSRTTEMEKLIQELLGDRLLELSKYITLESSTKTMIIDQTSLKSAGYQIVTH